MSTYEPDQLARWAAEMNTLPKRDYIFVYVWQFSKILADLACEPEHDKIFMEGHILSEIMKALDRGRYKGKHSFMGWLFLQAATAITGGCFSIHRTNVHTISLTTEEDATIDIEEEAPLPEDERFKQELTDLVYNIEDERAIRVIHMTLLEGRTLAETGEKLNISPSYVGHIRDMTLAHIRRIANDDAE